MATLTAKVTLTVAMLAALPATAEPARVENGVRVHYGTPQQAAPTADAVAMSREARVFIDPGYRGTELYEPLLSDYPYQRGRLLSFDGRFVHRFRGYHRGRPGICLGCFSTIVVKPGRD